MAILKQTAQTIEVTPQIACEYLEHPYPRQRPLRPWHIEELAGAIESGEFTTANISLVKVGDALYLVNGQHTLHAIVKTRKTVRLDVTKIYAETEEDANRIYALYDTQMRRSKGDSLRAMDIHNEIGVKSDFAIRADTALKFIEQDFHQTNVTSTRGHYNYSVQGRDASVRRLKEWQVEIRKARDILSHIPRSRYIRLCTSPVLSVMLITLRHQPEEAHTFWTSVAENDGLKKGTPAHTLLEWVTNVSVLRERPQKYVRAVAFCWNAFFAGEELSRIVVNQKSQELPVNIMGTPWKNRKR